MFPLTSNQYRAILAILVQNCKILGVKGAQKFLSFLDVPHPHGWQI